MRSSATAAVAWRASTVSPSRTTLSGSPGDAAQRQVAERFRRQPHAGEPRETDGSRLRKTPRPRPRPREMPQAAEDERERQRDPSCRSVPKASAEVDVVQRAEKQQDPDRERAPSDGAFHARRSSQVAHASSGSRLRSEQRLGGREILDGVDVAPRRGADVRAAHQPARGELPDPAAQRRVAASRAASSAPNSAGAQTNRPVSSASYVPSSLPIAVIRSPLKHTFVASAATSAGTGPASIARTDSSGCDRHLAADATARRPRTGDPPSAARSGDRGSDSRTASTETPFSRCQSGL